MCSWRAWGGQDEITCRSPGCTTVTTVCTSHLSCSSFHKLQGASWDALTRAKARPFLSDIDVPCSDRNGGSTTAGFYGWKPTVWRLSWSGVHGRSPPPHRSSYVRWFGFTQLVWSSLWNPAVIGVINQLKPIINWLPIPILNAVLMLRSECSLVNSVFFGGIESLEDPRISKGMDQNRRIEAEVIALPLPRPLWRLLP